MKRIWSRFLFASILLFGLVACGNSGAPSLEGRYAGTAGRSDEPITFILNQSGASVTGTTTFDGRNYAYKGTLSDDTLNGNATLIENSTYCRNLSFIGSTVTPNRSAISGTMTVRAQNCDGSGPVTGGTGTYAVSKQ